MKGVKKIKKTIFIISIVLGILLISGCAELKGDKGDKGDTGDVGPKGDTGDVGPKGDKGDASNGGVGPKGDTGDIGLTGPKGDTGECNCSISREEFDNLTSRVDALEAAQGEQ